MRCPSVACKLQSKQNHSPSRCSNHGLLKSGSYVFVPQSAPQGALLSRGDADTEALGAIQEATAPTAAPSYLDDGAADVTSGGEFHCLGAPTGVAPPSKEFALTLRLSFHEYQGSGEPISNSIRLITCFWFDGQDVLANQSVRN